MCENNFTLHASLEQFCSKFFFNVEFCLLKQTDFFATFQFRWVVMIYNSWLKKFILGLWKIDVALQSLFIRYLQRLHYMKKYFFHDVYSTSNDVPYRGQYILMRTWEKELISLDVTFIIAVFIISRKYIFQCLLVDITLIFIMVNKLSMDNYKYHKCNFFQSK